MINEMIRESAYPAMGCMALVSCKLTRTRLDTGANRATRSCLPIYHLSPISCSLSAQCATCNLSSTFGPEGSIGSCKVENTSENTMELIDDFSIHNPFVKKK
jgi:hypothetical protein